MAPVVAVWFRKGLRLHDNAPLLAAAAEAGARVLPFFILDYRAAGETTEDGGREIGRNRLRFLVESLTDLDRQLREKYGSRLVVFQGATSATLGNLVAGKLEGCPVVSKLFYEFDPEPFYLGLDGKLAGWCERMPAAKRPELRAFHAGHTILDLGQVREKIVGGGKKPTYTRPTKTESILSIFKGEFGDLAKVPKPRDAPKKLGKLPDGSPSATRFQVPALSALCGGKAGSNDDPSAKQFPGGETAALARLQKMVRARPDWVRGFRKPRTSSTNVKEGSASSPDWTTPSTTGLSPHLAFGTLSPRRVWHEVQDAAAKGKGAKSEPPESLHGQLLFRELFYVLSYTVDNWDSCKGNIMCKDIAWDKECKSKMQAWKSGQTGYPYIDALMRQLQQTGWMHHLGRHAVSCFLTRGDLYQSWTHGRDHFDKHLLDADWALNNGNWLWLAGVAPFSMPFFRVYSPIPNATSALNAEQTGDFVRFFVPELRGVDGPAVLDPAKVAKAGAGSKKAPSASTYPKPIVEHAASSKRNQAAFGKSQASLSQANKKRKLA